MEHYEKAVKADPNFVVTYFDIAYLYESLGRYDKALEYYREAYKHAHSDYWRREADRYIKEIQKRLKR
ncbi:MAG: tetratricopeptide repeat protein [Candidatus Odinarchaeota archaeon]|nr:tetratricopeptide repeat protein [Candidatus Odinarchaeota archaeon]